MITDTRRLHAADLALITGGIGICGLVSVGLIPAIIQQQTGFLLLASLLGLGVGLLAGLSGALASEASGVMLPRAWPLAHAAVAGAASGVVSLGLAAAIPLVSPQLFGAVFGVVAFLLAWVLLHRRAR